MPRTKRVLSTLEPNFREKSAVDKWKSTLTDEKKIIVL